MDIFIYYTNAISKFRAIIAVSQNNTGHLRLGQTPQQVNSWGLR